MNDIDPPVATPGEASADARQPAVFEVSAPAGAPDEGGRPAAAPDADTLIVLPVRDTVLFPGTVFPIALGRSASIAAAQQAVREERQIGVLMQRDSTKAEPSAGDFHSFGTVGGSWIVRPTPWPASPRTTLNPWRRTSRVTARPISLTSTPAFATCIAASSAATAHAASRCATSAPFPTTTVRAASAT